MVADFKSRAIFAGLAGAALWSVPVVAVAQPAGSSVIAPAVSGAVGAVAGALVAGGCSLLYLRQERRETAARMAELEARLAETLADSLPETVGRHAASGSGARPTLEAVAAWRAHEEVTNTSSLSLDPEDSGLIPSVATATEDVAAAAESETFERSGLEALVEPKLRDDSPFADVREWESRVPTLDWDEPAESMASSQQPVADPLSEKRATAAQTGIHTAVDLDYEDVASEYVERETFRQRMLTLSKGVAKVLQERLSFDMMEDLPMIQRADGSVGDVGTSWWENAVEEDGLEISRDLGKAIPDVEQTASEYRKSGLDSSAAFDLPFVYPERSTPRASATAGNTGESRSYAKGQEPMGRPNVRRAADIAKRIPTMEPEAFPEEPPREYDRDAWDIALEALDEHFDDNLVTGTRVDFADLVGGGDTLDEPDGLERSTRHLGFRAPAGHPEVTDTSSYVDFLVSSEFAAVSPKVGARALKVLAASR